MRQALTLLIAPVLMLSAEAQIRFWPEVVLLTPLSIGFRPLGQALRESSFFAPHDHDAAGRNAGLIVTAADYRAGRLQANRKRRLAAGSDSRWCRWERLSRPPPSPPDL